MTVENAEYCHLYLAPFGSSGMLYRSFGPEDYSELGELPNGGAYSLWYFYQDLGSAR